MNIPQSHVAPVAASAVSCVIGFDLHTFLGYFGQVVGVVSGILSIAWVIYQIRRERKKDA